MFSCILQGDYIMQYLRLYRHKFLHLYNRGIGRAVVNGNGKFISSPIWVENAKTEVYDEMTPNTAPGVLFKVLWVLDDSY